MGSGQLGTGLVASVTDVKSTYDVLKNGEKPEEALTQNRDALITRAREHILDRRKVVDPEWEKAKRIICSSTQ